MSSRSTDDRHWVRLVEPGTLTRPGPLGRVARFLLGLACGWGLVNLIWHGGDLVFGGLLAVFPGWWIFIGLGWWVFPAVVGVGFGVQVSVRVLRGASLFVGCTAAAVSWLWLGSPFEWPLGGLVYVWLWYTYGHLTLSLLLAALIATPGCEMRAIPQLWGQLTGRPGREHYCPGFFTGLDEWEATR